MSEHTDILAAIDAAILHIENPVAIHIPHAKGLRDARAEIVNLYALLDFVQLDALKHAERAAAAEATASPGGEVKLNDPELQRQLDQGVARYNELPQWIRDAATPPAGAPAEGDAEYDWNAAHEALESLDDFARMDVGVNPYGPYAVLRDLLTKAKAWKAAASSVGGSQGEKS